MNELSFPVGFEPPTAATLADYDDAMRTRAGDGVLLRSAMPVALHRQAQKIRTFWADRHTRRLMVDIDGTTTPAAAADVAACLTIQGPLAAAVDHRALRAFQNMSKMLPDLRNQPEVEGSIPLSSRVVVLTTKLSERFWIGADRDPANFNDWLDALALSRGPSSVPRVVHLLSKWLNAADGSDTQVQYATSADRRDKADDAMSKALYGDYYSPNFAFSLAEYLSAMWSHHTSTDPLLRHRAAVGGSVVRSTSVGRGGGGIRLRLEGPPAGLAEGKEVAIFSANSQIDAALLEGQIEHFTMDGDSMVALVTGGRSFAGAASTAAVSDPGAAVFIAKKPFGSAPKRPFGRWEGRRRPSNVNPPRQFDPPAYVVIAGAGAGA